MSRLRAATAVVPGLRTVFQPVQNLVFTAGRPAKALYQYTMQSAKRTSHGNLVSEREKISGKEITTFQQVKSKNAKSDKSGKIGQELLILNY